MAKKCYQSKLELALTKLSEQLTLPQSLQDNSQVIHVLCFTSRVNQYVIDYVHHEHVQVWLEHLAH